MKLTSGKKILGIPEDFKFGIEIEADNVSTYEENGLYIGKSAEYIKKLNWHMATKSEEALVGKGGAELVSPILKDNEEDWENIENICEHIKKYPGKKGEYVEANSKCGLHVHFDSNCLMQNPKKFRNFMRIYAEAEELIYKMCNDKNDPIRQGAINKNYKGLTQLVSSIWRNGMASPSGKKILKQIEKGTLKVSYKKFGKLKMAAARLKLDERRYHGLNITNIGNQKKNTIEFRMANGTLDPRVIKENVFLYASLINTAIKATEHPKEYEERLREFYRTDITEEKKAERFLNLIMENENDKKIYMERYQSVKDAKVFFNNHKKGFAKDRFTKEQFAEIAKRTPVDRIKATYNYIKNNLSNIKHRNTKEGEKDCDRE